MNPSRAERYVEADSKYSTDDVPSLDAMEIATVKKKIAFNFKLTVSWTNRITQYVHFHGNILRGVFAMSATFNLAALELPIHADEHVYLVWDDWNDVDETSWKILCEEFRKIWFPVADDLDIFDAKGRWALLIDHNGGVKVFQP